MTPGVLKIKAGLGLVDVNDFSAHREYEECSGKQSRGIMIYQRQHSITFNRAHDLKNKNVMVKRTAGFRQNHQKILKVQKNQNIYFGAEKKSSSTKIKKRKNDQSFQRLSGPTPQKNAWKMILSLFNSTPKHLPHFFQGPHRNALGTGTTLLRMRTRPRILSFFGKHPKQTCFLSSEKEKYQIHKEVFKTKEEKIKKGSSTLTWEER